MLACRINFVLGSILAIPTIPIQLVTTLVGGCLVGCSFGLLLIPLSLIWLCFLALLIATSWAWDKLSALRWPPLVAASRAILALVGLPLALVAQTYVALIPSMGDIEGRAEKLMLSGIWPFTIDYMHFSKNPGLTPDDMSPQDALRFTRVLEAHRIASGSWRSA